MSFLFRKCHFILSDNYLLTFRDWRGAQGCKSDRSREKFSNEYLFTKTGVDADENEPLKVHSIFKPRDSIFAEPPRPRLVAELTGPYTQVRTGGGPGQAKLQRARSRLYRSQILQVNTRWKALAQIYTMHSFAPFSTLMFCQTCAIYILLILPKSSLF